MQTVGYIEFGRAVRLAKSRPSGGCSLAWRLRAHMPADKLSNMVLVDTKVKHVRRVAADKLSNMVLVDTQVKHVWSSLGYQRRIKCPNFISRAETSDRSRGPKDVI